MPDAIAAEMAEIKSKREASQPRNRTGGSTFKNPPGTRPGNWSTRPAAAGLNVGGAQVSELHCNFLINLGGATAADIETLGEDRARAREGDSGVELEWEIKRIGVASNLACGTGRANVATIVFGDRSDARSASLAGRGGER